MNVLSDGSHGPWPTTCKNRVASNACMDTQVQDRRNSHHVYAVEQYVSQLAALRMMRGYETVCHSAKTAAATASRCDDRNIFPPSTPDYLLSSRLFSGNHGLIFVILLAASISDSIPNKISLNELTPLGFCYEGWSCIECSALQDYCEASAGWWFMTWRLVTKVFNGQLMM